MMANRPCGFSLSLVSLALGCALAMVSQPQDASSQALPSLEGTPVVSIRIVDQSGEVVEASAAGLPLRNNQPFTMEAERDSLRQLFRSGDYADIAAQAEPVAGGLRVDFVVQRNFYVNDVTIDGLHEPPSDSLAISSLRLGLGEPFREADMPAAVERLQSTLKDEGLYEAKVTYDLFPQPDTRQMDIHVHVVPGPRALIGAVKLLNQSPFPEQDVRKRLKLNAKAKLTSATLDRSVSNTRKWLTDRGYLGPRVSISRGT